MNTYRRFIVVAALAAALIALAGCQQFGSKAAWEEKVGQLEALSESWDAQIGGIKDTLVEYEAQLASIPDDDALADKVRDAIEDTAKALEAGLANKAKVDAALVDLRRRIALIDESSGETAVVLDGVAATIAAGGGQLPPPYNLLALLASGAVGLAAGFWKRRPGDVPPEKHLEALNATWDEATRAAKGGA